MLNNLYRILDEFSTLKARGEYWEVYNAEEWIGVQLSPYKGNVIISIVMTDNRYKLWHSKLWLKLGELTLKHMIKTAYLCDVGDLWWYAYKKPQEGHQEGHMEMEVEVPVIKEQNALEVRRQNLRNAYGKVYELDDIFYPSCWAMWFYDLGASNLTRIADFNCFRNEPCGRGRFVQLYKDIADYAQLESRAIQRAFGPETGIDRKAEDMIFWLKTRKTQ